MRTNKENSQFPVLGQARGAFLSAFLVTAVVLVWSFPIITSPRSVILGHPGDSLSFIDRLEHWQLSAKYIERPLLNILGILLSRVLGSIAAYNLLVISSFPLTAAAAFFLFYRLVRNTWAALSISILFALAPFHWARSLGHLYLAHIEWIPLFVLSLLGFFGRQTVLSGLAVLLSYALLLGSSFYLGFFVAVLGMTLVVPGLIYVIATRRIRHFWMIIVAALVAAAGSLPMTYSYIVWLFSRPSPRVELLDELFRFSARPVEYLLPGGFSALRRIVSPILTPGSLHASNEVEQAIFLGWIPMGLALLGIAATLGVPFFRLLGLKNRSPRGIPGIRKDELVWIGFAGIVAAILSGPPAVRLFETTIFTPNYYISRLIPFFRSYSRMAVFVQLAVFAWAAVGMAYLLRMKNGKVMVQLLLLLGIIEFTPVPPPRILKLDPPKPAYLWLSEQSGGDYILEFPFNTRATPRTTVRAYFRKIHGRFSVSEISPCDLRHINLLDERTSEDIASAKIGLILLHHRGPEPPLQVLKDRPERGLNLPGSWPVVDSGSPLVTTAHFPGTVAMTFEHQGPKLALSRSDGVGKWTEASSFVGAPLLPTAKFLLHNRGRKPVTATVELLIAEQLGVRGWRYYLNGLPMGDVVQQADTLVLRAKGLEVLPDINPFRLEALDGNGQPMGSVRLQPVAILLRARIFAQHGDTTSIVSYEFCPPYRQSKLSRTEREIEVLEISKSQIRSTKQYQMT